MKGSHRDYVRIMYGLHRSTLLHTTPTTVNAAAQAFMIVRLIMHTRLVDTRGSGKTQGHKGLHTASRHSFWAERKILACGSPVAHH